MLTRDSTLEDVALTVGAQLTRRGLRAVLTGADVWSAYSTTMKVAERVGKAGELRADSRRMVV
jgi:hypothetical protein